MIYLRQSTASQEIPLGYFVDSTDGNTEETALTIANTDIKLWKTGATTLANKNSGGATHISNGIYYAVLDATDTNTLGPMVIFVHASGALTVRVETCVLTALVYDSLIAGSDNLQVDILQAAGTAWGSGAITAASIATDAITAAKIATDFGTEVGTAVWATAARTLTAGTNIVLAKGTGVTGFNDLDAAAVATAVWNAATATYGTAGSYGLIIETNLDAAVSTRSSQSSQDTLAGYVDTEVAAIKAKTDNLPSDPADASVIAGRFDTLDANLATVDTVVDAILVDTAEIGAAGAGLTALASAANLATVAGYLDTEIAGIKAKTDLIPAAPAAVGDIPTANQNADALLDRAAGVETNRTPRQAMRLMLASLTGKLSGAATTTVTIRDTNDTKDRIVATVDADGNRSAVTLDAS